MYNKVLFRGDKLLQVKELDEIQLFPNLPIDIGLNKGGVISLINNSIYIDEASICLSTSMGKTTFLVPHHKLPLEDGDYYLTLKEEVIEEETILLNPITGGPFVGSMGNPRLSLYLTYTKDRGDIHVFSISNLNLEVSEFFTIENIVPYPTLVEEIGDYVEYGLDVYKETASTIVVRPGTAFIQGITFELDMPHRLDIPINDGRYLIYISKERGIFIEPSSELDIDILSIFDSSGSTLSTRGGSTIIKNTPYITKTRGLSVAVLTVEEGSVDIELLLNRSSIKNITLDSLMDEVIEQRYEITRLSHTKDVLSKTGVSLRPDASSSDPYHYSSLFSFYSGGVQAYIKELSASRLGNLETSDYLVREYISQPNYGKTLLMVEGSLSPSIKTIPNYIPSLNGVPPRTLEFDIEADNLLPLDNYYISINGIPNYSNPITTNAAGYLSTSVVLSDKDLTDLLLSISIVDKKEEVVSIALDRNIKSAASNFNPSNSYIGEKIYIEDSIYVYSISLGLNLSRAIANRRIASVYICDTTLHIKGEAHISSEDLYNSSELVFEEPLYLSPGYYYLLVMAHVNNLSISYGERETESHMIICSNSVIEEDLEHSLLYSIRVCETDDSNSTKYIDIDTIDIQVDTNSYTQYLVNDVWQEQYSLEASSSRVVLPPNPLVVARLYNSFKFSSELSDSSTWVSKQYYFNRGYRKAYITVESSTEDISLYISPNHKSWDKATLISINKDRDLFVIKYSVEYPKVFYLEEGLSVLRDKLSVLIDLESSTVRVSRVDINITS